MASKQVEGRETRAIPIWDTTGRERQQLERQASLQGDRSGVCDLESDLTWMKKIKGHTIPTSKGWRDKRDKLRFCFIVAGPMGSGKTMVKDKLREEARAIFGITFDRISDKGWTDLDIDHIVENNKDWKTFIKSNAPRQKLTATTLADPGWVQFYRRAKVEYRKLRGGEQAKERESKFYSKCPSNRPPGIVQLPDAELALRTCEAIHSGSNILSETTASNWERNYRLINLIYKETNACTKYNYIIFLSYNVNDTEVLQNRIIERWNTGLKHFLDNPDSNPAPMEPQPLKDSITNGIIKSAATIEKQLDNCYFAGCPNYGPDILFLYNTLDTDEKVSGAMSVYPLSERSLKFYRPDVLDEMMGKCVPASPAISGRLLPPGSPQTLRAKVHAEWMNKISIKNLKRECPDGEVHQLLEDRIFVAKRLLRYYAESALYGAEMRPPRYDRHQHLFIPEEYDMYEDAGSKSSTSESRGRELERTGHRVPPKPAGYYAAGLKGEWPDVWRETFVRAWYGGKKKRRTRRRRKRKTRKRKKRKIKKRRKIKTRRRRKKGGKIYTTLEDCSREYNKLWHNHGACQDIAKKCLERNHELGLDMENCADAQKRNKDLETKVNICKFIMKKKVDEIEEANQKNEILKDENEALKAAMASTLGEDPYT